MELKYSLLSGAEICGSRGGLGMGGSIIHPMPFEPDFIRAEIDNQSYQISIHADDERLADGLTIAELETALLDCEIILCAEEIVPGIWS